MTEGTPDASHDAMVRAFLAAWERRDTPYILDCFTDDAVYHSIPLAPIVGKEAILAFVTKFADVVMNERTDYMTLNGSPVVLPICGVFEIEGGRIKAWREYFDLSPAKAAYATD